LLNLEFAMEISATENCLTPLYRGELFALDDWRCAGCDSPGRHEEWCADDRLVITRRGLWELSVAGQKQIADPLQALLWNGQSGFRVRHPIGGADHCTVLRLTQAGSAAMRGAHTVIDTAITTISEQPTFVRASQSLSARSFWLHSRLLQATRQFDSLDRLLIEQAALELLDEIGVPNASTTQAKQSVRSSQATDRLRHRRAAQYVDHARLVIAKRFAEPLTVSEIAKTVACSPFHLARQFKRMLGVSLHQAVIAWRLRVGLEQVLDQPEQLARIALDLGFASHSHFTDSFRAHYGCSPQQARRARLTL
jgi:AraC family transcriptional regulator